MNRGLAREAGIQPSYYRSDEDGGLTSQTPEPSSGRILILVENLSVPFDGRVWQEARSLHKAGFEVEVVCPQGTGDEGGSFEIREGITIHRYRSRPASGGALSYLIEYVWACLQTWRIARRLASKRRFSFVHACNPPDLLLPTVVQLKRSGARFIFDHHDLVPELYLTRFRKTRGLVFRILLALERLSFRLADVVIATNESYRRVAIERGRKRPEDVFVVRNAPDFKRLYPVDPDPLLKREKPYLIAYLGLMGPQDGVDQALRALALLAERRDDWHAIFAGDGDVLPDMRALAASLGLSGAVDFPGRIGDDDVRQLLSTADVCLSPEPSNPLNDASTMVKIGEYMAMAKPVVAYALPESRVTAKDAALFASSGDIEEFASCIDALLEDDSLRLTLGERGRTRIESQFSWHRAEEMLVKAYSSALSH